VIVILYAVIGCMAFSVALSFFPCEFTSQFV